MLPRRGAPAVVKTEGEEFLLQGEEEDLRLHVPGLEWSGGVKGRGPSGAEWRRGQGPVGHICIHSIAIPGKGAGSNTKPLKR